MPEQLTKHPEVTLQVLRSAGARCGTSAPQEILTRCPPERFCKLPGGEVCVYGFADAARMTQPTVADWQALAHLLLPAPAPPPATCAASAALLYGLPGLLIGAALAAMFARLRRSAAPGSR
jgi:hypothetical protein